MDTIHGSMGCSRRALVSVVLMALAGACESPEPVIVADAGPPDANSVAPTSSYQLTWGPLTIEAGVEGVKCVTKRLGNDVAVNVSEIHNVLGNVSHHLIVYRSTDTEERAEPYDCNSIENLVNEENGLPLMITQKAEETLTLPAGVAFAMAPGQLLRLELHYINTGDTAAQVEVSSTFTLIPDADFEHAADLLFIGNPDIDIRAGRTATLDTYFPLPFGFEDSQFFGMTGHEHQWGTNVYVEIKDSPTGEATPVYDLPDFNWSEPETVYLEPPVSVDAAGGFRFVCDWNNTGDRRVRFGEGANDEMCFFWTYYYPSKGALTCFHTEQLGETPLDLCCPGHQLCNLIDDVF